jgi:isopenicillin N synthase-like dioxygenase
VAGGHRADARGHGRYFKTLERVGEQMLPVLARVLDMPAGCFAPLFANEAHINLRFLHYPPQEVTTTSSSGRAAHRQFVHHHPRPHRGAGAGGAPAHGEWLAPPLIEGTFLVIWAT